MYTRLTIYQSVSANVKGATTDDPMRGPQNEAIAILADEDTARSRSVDDWIIIGISCPTSLSDAVAIFERSVSVDFSSS